MRAVLIHKWASSQEVLKAEKDVYTDKHAA